MAKKKEKAQQLWTRSPKGHFVKVEPGITPENAELWTRDAKGHFIKPEPEPASHTAVGVKDRLPVQGKSKGATGKAKADKKLSPEKIDAVLDSLRSGMKPENQGQGQKKETAPPGAAAALSTKEPAAQPEPKKKRRHHKKAAARQTLVEVQTDQGPSSAMDKGSGMIQSVEGPDMADSPELETEKAQEIAAAAAKELEDALAKIKPESGVVIPTNGEGKGPSGAGIKLDKRWPYLHRNGHVKPIMKRAIVFSNKPRGFRQKDMQLPLDQLNKAGIIPVKDVKGWIYPVVEIITEELKTVKKDGVDTQEVVTTKTWSNYPHLEMVKGTSSFDLWKAVRGWWMYKDIHAVEGGWWEKATGVASWVIVGLMLIIVLMWLYFKIVAR